jgi:hypothetical protein
MADGRIFMWVFEVLIIEKEPFYRVLKPLEWLFK